MLTRNKYLSELNDDLFPTGIKTAKKGDTIIYVGGTKTNSYEITKNEYDIESNAFTKGKEYICRNDYDKAGYDKGTFRNYNGNIGVSGHISVEQDDNGGPNGWAACLFKLKEKGK